ncbi:MAG TPA: aromatic ring-hydroxylating dioxygenase subunit alpha [Steroidobacteraceae bacterium]|nr:aromatic ring-hydroxylating dioxygenase subunit alpha [Steroidobacteraceae bacterium]
MQPSSQPDLIDRLIEAHAPGLGLARDFYMDASVFARDMDCIFRRHWHCAGHISLLEKPGDFFTIDYEQEEIILTRDAGGAVHAFLNVCRHRGARICSEKSGNTSLFVCPYHAWTYRLDGSLKGARQMHPGFDPKSHGLKKLHVRIAEGLIFISFAQRPLNFAIVAEALRTTCGRYGWANAKIAHRQTYSLTANWKLAVENYVECYHCAPAHPEYAKTHALEQPLERIETLNAKMEERTRALGVEVVTGNHWRNSATGNETIHTFRYALYDGVSTGSEDGSPIAPPMGDFTGFDGGVTSIHVGGSSFLVCYADYGMIYRFVPRTWESSEMELIWLVREDAVEGRDYDFEKLTWLWKVTTDEDKSIIERTAAGVRSHYFRPGPIAPMEYNELRYITWYLDEVKRRDHEEPG